MSIIWDNTSSDKFGMILQNDIDFDSVERDVEVLEIPGRNGGVIVDNKRYKIVDFPLHFRMRRLKESVNIESQIKSATSWLSQLYGFKDLTWIGESEFIYRAGLNGKAVFKRITASHVDISVPIRFQPFKYYKDTYSTVRALKSGESFQNKGTQPAYPIITLTGTGNVTLTVNDKTFVIKNITEGVVIDCENQVVTDLTKKHSQMDKVYSYPFPNLKIGSNTISWDNTGFTGTIIERWCELA